MYLYLWPKYLVIFIIDVLNKTKKTNIYLLITKFQVQASKMFFSPMHFLHKPGRIFWIETMMRWQQSSKLASEMMKESIIVRLRAHLFSKTPYKDNSYTYINNKSGIQRSKCVLKKKSKQKHNTYFLFNIESLEKSKSRVE